MNMVIIMSGAPRLERTTSTQATAAMRRWTHDDSLPSVRPSHERRREHQRRQPPSRSRLGHSTDLIGPIHLRPFAG
jgi:hypothetical protein